VRLGLRLDHKLEQTIGQRIRESPIFSGVDDPLSHGREVLEQSDA
jgi:hypothetical protein